MKYGFDQTPTDSVTLPPVRTRPAAPAADIGRALQAGQELGFVSRDATARRKPGPKQREPQDRTTIAGPKRVLDRLKAYCDRHGASYCEAIDALLDMAEAKRE